MYNLLMQVLAVGRCESSAGLIVTDGIGWNPSSDAGKAGDPVQKYTYERKIIRIPKVIFITIFFGKKYKCIPGLVFPE